MNLFTRFLILCWAPFLALAPTTLHAQCVPDSLVPSTPGVYPDSLAPIPGCEYQEVDITFLLPRDTTTVVFGQNFVVPFNFFQIEDILGLPPGMDWDCNLNDSCHYDVAPGNPSPDTLGCVQLFGSPAIPGTYTLTVVVRANVTILGNSADQIATYSRTLEVGACSFGSDCYTYSLDAVCPPATLQLSNQISGINADACAYQWELTGPNGLLYQTSDADPQDQVLTEAGSYVLSYEAEIDTFPWQIDSIHIQTVNCSDPFDAGDLYWIWTDPSGTQLLNTSGSPVSNANLPLTINLSGAVLDSGSYELQVWDDDQIGGDDGCAGSSGASLLFTAPPSSNGPITIINNGLTATFFVRKPTQTLACSDTFALFAPPAQPVIRTDTLRICAGDSVQLTAGSPDSLQWYQDFAPLPGANDTVLWAKETGFYQVEAIGTESLCRSLSEWVYLEVVAVPAPSIAYDGNGRFTIAAPSPEQRYHWFDADDQLVGQGSPFRPGSSGIYYAVAEDTATGCRSAASSSLNIILTDVAEAMATNAPELFPNPATDFLHIHWELSRASAIEWQLRDLMGRPLQRGEATRTTQWEEKLDLRALPHGMYLLELRSEQGRWIKRFHKQ